MCVVYRYLIFSFILCNVLDGSYTDPAVISALSINALYPFADIADLDVYISRYSGYTKLRRLDWISQRCPALAPDCYRAALTMLRNGLNTSAYREISARARQLMGPEYAEDTEWVAQVGGQCRVSKLKRTSRSQGTGTGALQWGDLRELLDSFR